MKKTRLRVLEDMLIHKEKIKSEDSSLSVENTAEDLRASISCIESNKIYQETSSKGKNIIPTAKDFWESGHYDQTGVKASMQTRMRSKELIECEANTDYVTSTKTYIIRGYDKDRNFIQNIGVVSASINQIFTTDENVFYLGVAVDKVFNEYDEDVDKLFIYKNSESDKSWEKGYVDMPSTEFESEVEGLTGDVSLKVQTKNLVDNKDISIEGISTFDFKPKTNKEYFLKLITENDSDKSVSNICSIYLSEGYNNLYQISSSANSISKTKYNAINTVYHFKITDKEIIDKCKEIRLYINKDAFASNGFTKIKGLMVSIEEIAETEFVEHKEQNFTVSLGNKTLYKGDKISRKDGKWYFSRIWKYFNDFSSAYLETTNSANKKRFRIPLNENFKITDSSYNKNDGFSNKFKLLGQGKSYECEEGFTVGLQNSKPNIWIYVESWNSYTSTQFKEALNENEVYFLLPLENEELEEITDENLISQLDKILYYIKEYDNITNFDFDKDITFEIEVEKDRLRILEQRLDKSEENTTNVQMLALESED